jgi:hypothetical protein
MYLHTPLVLIKVNNNNIFFLPMANNVMIPLCITLADVYSYFSYNVISTATNYFNFKHVSHQKVTKALNTAYP